MNIEYLIFLSQIVSEHRLYKTIKFYFFNIRYYLLLQKIALKHITIFYSYFLIIKQAENHVEMC